MRFPGPRGTTTRRERFVLLKIHLVEGCTVLIKAVPHYRFDDNFTVTRSPVVRSSLLVWMPS